MEFPRGGLIGKALSLLRQLRQMNIPVHAANAGYFIVLSVFPMLVLLLGLLRLTDLDAADLMNFLSGYLPAALRDEAQTFIIHTYAYTGAAVVSVSAVGALWSASRGIYGIVRGLNTIYDVREDRRWLYRRVISVGYTFLFLLALVLSLVINVFGEYLLGRLPRGLLWRFFSGILDFRFLFMLLLQTAIFTAMYAVLPNRKNTLRSSLPGALVASLGWLVFSDLFSLYVEYFGGYSGVYGSIYAVALGMLWLYFCLCLLFFGAAINKIMDKM